MPGGVSGAPRPQGPPHSAYPFLLLLPLLTQAFPSVAQTPIEVPTSPIGTGAQRGQAPILWELAWLPSAHSQGVPWVSSSPVLQALSSGNPRRSRSGTGSQLPRPVESPEPSGSWGALAFHPPRGYPASRPPPNISGFYLVLDLSRKKTFQGDHVFCLQQRTPAPQGGFSLTPQVPVSALSETLMPGTPCQESVYQTLLGAGPLET